MGHRTHGLPKLRCSARAKSTGRRCGRSAIVGTVVCDIHGGGAPQTIAAASVRLSLAELSAVNPRPIRQILATLVDEDPPIQVVVQRAQIRQAKRPDNQAGRRGTARGQRNAVLRTELANLVGEQQQLRQSPFADRADLFPRAFQNVF